jgi:hypothetical protein
MGAGADRHLQPAAWARQAAGSRQPHAPAPETALIVDEFPCLGIPSPHSPSFETIEIVETDRRHTE